MTSTALVDTSLPDPDTSAWGGRHAHDPTAVTDDDGTYWLFSTDACSTGPVRGGVQVRRSRDLVTWEFHGWALDGVPEPARRWSGAEGLWAPDVVRVTPGPGRAVWRMYYSASTFGSRTSAIGLATAAHPGGPWTDEGLVVVSRHDTPGPNAIDANLVVTPEGAHHLVYGSFFGGIHALELDPATGFALDARRPGAPASSPGVLLARRPAAVDGAVEGAFVLPRPGGGWAMLVSYDSLSSTYHVRAAVAPDVTGPWRDARGHALTDLETDPTRVGTTVLASHRLTGGRRWLAPGHGSVVTTPDHQVFVHHVRDGDAPTEHEVQSRRLVWTHGGWPLVSPQPWAGDREEDDQDAWPDDAAALLGTWEVVTFDGPTDQVTLSREVTETGTGLPDAEAHGRGRFTLAAPPAWATADAGPWDVVVLPSWDAVRGQRALSFTALDARGVVTVGTRVGS
ncbi:arabinan endo-1,5-alpha-L-arabinosidase [Oerskovia flava]|uniref:arabinan endo-1,5-alpha-L-arabinosidase n=1 Tax=Oerskovia flava TaxID=2986422 RepID=UPI00224087A2|nr:arabinan endo-1,5-alpha-L-arabinosidase [Oerskovia sp. JB1-3-2]